MVPDRARLREDTGDQPVDRDRRSGGIFAPSLFIGVTSGMAYGDIVRHIFGAGAGQPALYAVVAMGAVFTSAARAPLTSLASVLEMRGDFALTLPVKLAVAIASTVSRALSNGTIYTTKRNAAA